MNIRYLIFVIWLAVVGCTKSVPADAVAVDALPDIYPDYIGVTAPSNIAPLNFTIMNAGDDYVTRLHAGDTEVVVTGKTLDVDVDDWHRLLSGGSRVEVEVYVRDNGQWRRYKAFGINVAEDIDPYISYRLIEPSYVNYEVMRICQRCLENFDEEEIFNNCAFSDDEAGQCINCHSYQDYNRGGNMQMHVRANHGGTLIVRNGNVAKVNLKCPETVAAGVYPAWHPTLPLIAYSSNTTAQTFHQLDSNKIEVYDSRSQLMLYDVDRDQVTMIVNDTTTMPTFPAWSPDGSTLYYVSAPKPADGDVPRHYKDVRYDVYRMAFDKGTLTFAEPDTVLRASAMGKSAALPRVSPDGRYLLLSMGSYGTFHIWHHDADLYLLDLQTGSVRALCELNSDDTDSYHSWSSNGRWILFSSRRDDGSYTRFYIAYFDKDGKAHKPLMLPQRDPRGNTRLLKSYNVPEFMVAPVTVSRSQLLDALK